MSNPKSKLPDLKELGEMSSKLYKSLSSCVIDIIDDYKKKRTTEAESTETKEPAEPTKSATTEPQPTNDTPKVTEENSVQKTSSDNKNE